MKKQSAKTVTVQYTPGEPVVATRLQYVLKPSDGSVYSPAKLAAERRERSNQMLRDELTRIEAATNRAMSRAELLGIDAAPSFESILRAVRCIRLCSDEETAANPTSIQ